MADLLEPEQHTVKVIDKRSKTTRGRPKVARSPSSNESGEEKIQPTKTVKTKAAKNKG